MPVAGFSSHRSLSCPVCKVGKTVIMADYRGRWLGCNSCSLNTVTSLSNTTAEHSVCKHMGTLWFFGCWGSIPLHPPISWFPVPFAMCHVRGTDRDYPPQGAVGNHSNKGDWLAVCPTGPQPSCWCDTGARGTWPVSTRTT